MAEDFWNAGKLAGESVVEALLVASAGVKLGWDGVMDKKGRQVVSQLCANAFVPALVFDKLCRSVTLQDVVTWWTLPLNVLASILGGGATGIGLAKLAKVEKAHHMTFLCASALGNLGNLPLVLVHAVCTSENTPFGAACEERGIAYVAFGMFVATLVQWSVANVLLAPPKPPVRHQCELSEWNARDAQPGGTTDEGAKEQEGEGSEKDALIERDEIEVEVPKADARPNVEEWKPMESIGEAQKQTRERQPYAGLLKQLLTPPVLATFLALFIGAVPALKGLLYGAGAPLAPLSNAIAVVGGGMVPSLLILLGSLLSEGPATSTLQKRTVLLIVGLRGAILPVMGMGFVALLKVGGCLPPDPLFQFVLLIQHTLPSAINLSTIATMHDHNALEMSSLLFYQYIAAIFFMPAFLTVYLKIL
mmetsp:Transcript_5903/g.20781  ORF Transcript_5903/g.20781 Transcript_5903/m.20781 type:complete len:420 (+) Transcript_5903:1335-2594(+)